MVYPDEGPETGDLYDDDTDCAPEGLHTLRHTANNDSLSAQLSEWIAFQAAAHDAFIPASSSLDSRGLEVMCQHLARELAACQRQLDRLASYVNATGLAQEIAQRAGERKVA